MIFQPALLALISASLISTLLILAGALFAFRVLRHWDFSRSDARQIALERQTALAGAGVALAMGLQALSVPVFVFNAERMSVLFTGAMCATGTLSVNDYGFPTLLLKLLGFFLAIGWLALDQADRLGRDYPLTRLKYAWLLLAAPVFLAESATQLAYFLHLDPAVITSCCGSLFSDTGPAVTNDLAGWPPLPTLVAYFGFLGAAVAAGLGFLATGRGGLVFSGLVLGHLPLALATLVATLSLYVYEHPHHHCPFCLLKSDFDYIGYPLYLLLFAATGHGLATLLQHGQRHRPSLAAALPARASHHARRALLYLSLYGALSAFLIQRANLNLIE